MSENKKQKRKEQVTPIQASRQLLAVLSAVETADFEAILRNDAFLQIWSDNHRQVYWSRPHVYQALLAEAAVWSDPIIHIQRWDEEEQAASVQFQIWIEEDGTIVRHNRSATITLRDAQVEMISLYCKEGVAVQPAIA